MSVPRFLSFTLFLAVLIGCGGRQSGQTVQPPPPDAKVTLEAIAASGDLSNKKEQLREELLGLGEADPAKSEELLTDYEQLIGLSGSAEIKAKAQEMADKL